MTATRHTHDPQAVERIAEAIARAENSYTGSMVVRYGGASDVTVRLEVTPRHRHLARVSLDAIDALYETEAGE